MNTNKPRRAGRIVLIVILAAAILAGGTFGAIRFAGSRSAEVAVYRVSDFSTSGDWYGGGQTDGIVSTDRIQSVYVSSTQQVTEIYVEEGQPVSAGDPLLAFDTTLSDLELERQGIRVEQLKLDIQNAEKQLAEINTYRIGSPTVYVPTYTEPTYSAAPYMPYDRAPEALGTQSDPLIWLWNDGCSFDTAFFLRIAAIAAANREAYRENGGSGEQETPIDMDEPAEQETPIETEEPAVQETPAETAAPTETEPPAETQAPAEPEAPAETAAAAQAETETETPAETETETEAPAQEDTSAEEEAPEDPAAPAEEETEAEDTESAAAPPEVTRLLAAAHTRLRLPEAGEDLFDLPAEDQSDPLMAEIDDPRIFIVFEVRTSDAPDGTIERVWEMILTLDAEGGWSAQMVTPNYDPGEDSFDDGSYYDYPIDTNVYYTAAEITQMKSDANERLRGLRLDLKAAELEYERILYELSGGEVVSKIDGVVKTVRDPDEALAENRPAVVVSGGGGYYITAVLGELDLDTTQVGDPVTVVSWENYQQLDGVITEISEYPDESGQYWYYSEGNQNVSTYPFKVFVGEDAELRDGEYVSVNFTANSGDYGLYLETPFIRQENGRSYVYTVGEDGLLEKRYIHTGKSLWGSYIEILGGLTAEDCVAFPYGRKTQEGARVRYAEPDELWSSVYGIG